VFQQSDKRFIYLRHQTNKGEPAARNTGIKAAQGEYIANHDSDDEWLPEKLERQLNVFQASGGDVGVVYTGYWYLLDNAKIYSPPADRKKKEGNIHDELIQGNFVGTPTTLIRRECFDKAGIFDQRLRHAVEWELWLRISKYYKFKIIDEPLVLVYHQRDSVSDNEYAYMDAMDLILSKHWEDFKKLKKTLPRRFSILAGIAFKNKDLPRSRRYMLGVIRFSHLKMKIRYLLFFFSTLLGLSVYNYLRTILSYKKFLFLKKLI
jgi:glycosyltransferase involved in cell wall biosynthesis